MGITGTNPSGEGIGIRIIDTARLTFSLRTPDAAGMAGDRYVAPKESSFTESKGAPIKRSSAKENNSPGKETVVSLLRYGRGQKNFTAEFAEHAEKSKCLQ